MGFSFSEILIVGLVAILVTKPSDIPKVIKFIREKISYLKSWKKQLTDYVEKEVLNEPDNSSHSAEETDQMNFFLEKIIEKEGKYQGEYNLSAVKAHYHQMLVKEKFRKKPKGHRK